MRVGQMGVGRLADWQPGAGKAVSWGPSAASLARAAQAPLSDVPVSYMQAQHIRGCIDQAAKGLEYSRLMIVSCDAPGQCDIRAMTYVINTHLQRHDTYRSRFEYHPGGRAGDNPDGELLRYTMPNAADIEFVPTKHGELTLEQARELVVSTPDSLNWDCFRFGVIQGEEHFTFYVSVDHVHVDAMIVGVTLTEFYFMYQALVGGNPPIPLPKVGSFDEFCVRSQDFNESLTPESPQIQVWMEFAEANENCLPDFPLPLGDPTVPCKSGLMTVQMMDEGQTADFETACRNAGARFIGGVLACAGLADHELTGRHTYYGLTPKDTRRTPQEQMTVGWFTGLIPVTVRIAGSTFDEAARAAQNSFDSRSSQTDVPYQRVLELAPHLSKARPNFPVLNFLDFGAAPLSVLLTAGLDDLNIGIYSDGRYSYQLSIYVIRAATETAVSVMLPDNPESHASVAKYLQTLKSVFARVAERGHWRDVA